MPPSLREMLGLGRRHHTLARYRDQLLLHIVRRCTGWIGHRTTPGALTRHDQLTLPPALLDLARGKLESWIASHPDDQNTQAMLAQDVIRFATAIRWLEPVLAPGHRALELGGGGAVTEILCAAFPHVRFEPGQFDLRRAFPVASESFDVVISMEVFEHVSDVQYLHATQYTGARNCLRETLRILKPGGRMFLTTPNAASTWVLQRALLQQPPWMWEHHFREYTVPELVALVEEAGFAVERVETEQVWHFWESFDGIVAMMQACWYPLEHRGDDIHLVARRPADAG